MEIRNLSHTPHECIFETWKRAFSDYFLPVNEDLYWNLQQWKYAGFDPSLSYGAFQDNELKAFILLAPKNEKELFNFSTGVVPELRGTGLMDEVFGQSVLELRKKNYTKMVLEVLDLNEKAVRLYGRLGFRGRRWLYTFDVDVPQQLRDRPKLKYQVIDQKSEEVHLLVEEDTIVARAVFRPAELFISSISAHPPLEVFAEVLLKRMKLEGARIRIGGVDEQHGPLLDFLRHLGPHQVLGHIEMEREL